MPLHLEPLDVSVDLQNYKSVLIVTCPICPPVSLATDKDSPFIEFFKSGIKTRAYEDFIQSIREPLEQRGVQTGYVDNLRTVSRDVPLDKGTA
jgi:hypothetical protein